MFFCFLVGVSILVLKLEGKREDGALFRLPILLIRYRASLTSPLLSEDEVIDVEEGVVSVALKADEDECSASSSNSVKLRQGAAPTLYGF